MINEKGYLSDPAGVELIPGATAALKRLMKANFRLIMVTNQAGIGRGYFTETDMKAVNDRLLALLHSEGVDFDKIYHAPEAPGQSSRGRKPSPQFLLDASQEFGIDLARSFMIGDKRSDLECGWNAGVAQSILVRTGYGVGTEADLGPDRQRTVIVDDLGAAAEWILRSRRSES